MIYDLIIKSGTVVTHEKSGMTDIAVKGGRIAYIGDCSADSADEVINAQGLHVLPGVIDTQVHFREPGNEHKEDLKSGSHAAVMGGVVAVFEMPNTKPPTTTPHAMADKCARAHHRMHCDYAFYGGATHENIDALAELERLDGVCGIKVFMGASTGSLLVPDDASIAALLAKITRRAAFHSEDEMMMNERSSFIEAGNVASHAVWRNAETALRSTQRLLRLARAAGKQIHVLHVTTKEEMALLAQNRDIASVEVTPQHLTLAAPDCYDRLGSFAQMNPPIREEAHQAGLWEGVRAGIVDVIGSDHAPHTREEKAQDYPASPSGMPGVQTLLPLMLNHVAKGRLDLQHLVRLTSYNAKRLFKLADKGELVEGGHADFTVVDLSAKREIEATWLASRCGWSPFTGEKITGWPCATIIRGHIVMREDELVSPSCGEAIKFELD